MQRRSYLALAGSWGVALAGCSETTDPAAGPRTNVTPTDSPTPTPTAVATRSETFEGTGSETTDGIDIERPAVFVSAEHEGSGYFALTFRDDQGERVSRPVNTRGQFDGLVARNLDPGTYTLDVSADGQWTVEVKRFRPLQSGTEPTVSTSHAWPWVFGPFQSPGAVQVQFEGADRTNYRMWRLANDASRQAQLFDEAGPTSRLSTTISGDSVFFVAIEGYGQWETRIEKP